MKVLKLLLFTSLTLSLLVSCQDDIDDNISPNNASSDLNEINDYIWKAMNIFYVYKSDAPDLADDRFNSDEEYTQFLSAANTPADFFNGLLANQDRFSFIVPDYVALEQSFDGISTSNGMEFGLVRFIGTETVFGYVRYVVPNSPAETAGIERGVIFNRIDGVVFTPETNFNQLLSQPNYTIGLAEFQGDNVVSLDQEVSLDKIQLTENPILEHKVLDIDGQKVGYLMYNNFRTPFNSELNSVFGQFAAEGITDLVLDLRYNSGGSIETAKDLSSMITGQFEGEIFAKQIFNENFDTENIFFDNQISTDETINSLNLSRVFILTTSSSASASELVINALDPYIDVIQIGRSTAGKFEGSVTLYDSPNFTRRNVNLDHTYAIQPLILKTANKNGVSDFFNGLQPDIEQTEIFSNLGVLGDPQETLLNRALQEISPEFERPSFQEKKSMRSSAVIGESKMNSPAFQRMYVDPNSISL